MAIPPRIIPRNELRGSAIEVPRALDPLSACGRPITLGGRMYRCWRETRRTDRQHDGIHDAFCEHGGGSVRW